MSDEKHINNLERIKRWFVRFFLSKGDCENSCSKCNLCPWLDKEKYTFEIKRKDVS